MVPDAFSAWLDAYGHARETRDPLAVRTLFTGTTLYQTTPFNEPMRDLEAIVEYWSRVTSLQEQIRFGYEILVTTEDLAKDYASVRQRLIDLIPALIPRWMEGHGADMGIALVDLLAYVGDDLSSYQDAIANEANLETARHRLGVAHWWASFVRVSSGLQVKLNGILVVTLDAAGRCHTFREWWQGPPHLV